jgi:hypothetical protein
MTNISAEEARRAVRIIDNWAMKYEVQAPGPCFHWFTSRVSGLPIPRWRIFLGLRAVGGYFATADQARVALAQKLVEQNPELERGKMTRAKTKHPTLRALTARLRELHAAWSHPDAGGEYVALWGRLTGTWEVAVVSDLTGGARIVGRGEFVSLWGRLTGTWEVDVVSDLTGGARIVGREYIPGDGARFDATAAARRLLAALRDHEEERAFTEKLERALERVERSSMKAHR